MKVVNIIWMVFGGILLLPFFAFLAPALFMSGEPEGPGQVANEALHSALFAIAVFLMSLGWLSIHILIVAIYKKWKMRHTQLALAFNVVIVIVEFILIFPYLPF